MSGVARQSGALMIELLVTLLVVSIGILGLMGLQRGLRVAEVEAYQRTQALLLLSDMATRIEINAGSAGDYRTHSPLGTGKRCPANSPAMTRVQRDRAQWCRDLRGTSEEAGGMAVGSLTGGRGCVRPVENGAPGDFRVTVAWQGLVPLMPPPDAIPCGKGQYDLPTGSACDRHPGACRRFVSAVVRARSLVAP